MSHIPTPQEALRQLTEALSAKKRSDLALAIKSLDLLINPPQNAGPGSFWRDPERGAAARKAMKAAWAARKPQLQLTWRSTGTQTVTTDYDEVAKLVGRAAQTVRIYISRGNGVAYFAYNDDIITVQKL